MFRWAFIGSVGIARTVAKQVIKNKDMTISCVYSRNYRHCKTFSRLFNCEAYKSFEDMLNERKFDAIYIATPHAYHYHYAVIALKNKIPVLCEKPIVLNLDAAKHLFALAKENETYFAEAMWTWFNPVANKVKDWVKGNRVGKPLTMTGDFSTGTMWIGRKPRLFKKNLGGGALYDVGVYPICYAYRLFGKPSKITSIARMNKDKIDLSCTMDFEYENGLKCHLTSGFLKFGNMKVEISGENGQIKVPLFYAARKAELISEDGETFIDSSTMGLYERELLLASKEIQNKQITSSYQREEDTIAVLEIMEEVKKQIGLVYNKEIE